MRSEDDIRREFDSGDNFFTFGPGARANGHAKEAPPRLKTVWADAIDLKLDQAGLVDGLLGLSGMTVIYGESGAGKTFVAVDLACHVAAGMPWRGLAVEQGVVIYVAAESPASVERRIWAWKQRHGIERLPVLVVQSSVNLLDGDAETAVAELVRQVQATHGRVALVVIDTLARAMIGNENAPDDMGAFVAACGNIRQAGETHIAVIHHSGKDAAKGARGHSCLRAATDVEIEVTKGEGGGCIKVTKSRDEEDGQSYGFRLERVELGTNAKGRIITTCVAVEAEAPTQPEKQPKLTPKQRTVLDCLATAIADHGEAAPPAPDIPRNARVVRLERWREAAVRYLPADDEPWRKNADFKRTAETLQGKGLVKHVAGFCWLPSQTSQTSHCEGVRGTASTLTTSQTSQHPLKGARLRGGCEAPRAAAGGEGGEPYGEDRERPDIDAAGTGGGGARTKPADWTDHQAWGRRVDEARQATPGGATGVVHEWLRAAGARPKHAYNGEQPSFVLPATGLPDCPARGALFKAAAEHRVHVKGARP